MASKLHNWCVQIILLLLEISDNPAFKLFLNCSFILSPIFQLRMHRHRLAGGLCASSDPAAAAAKFHEYEHRNEHNHWT